MAFFYAHPLIWTHTLTAISLSGSFMVQSSRSSAFLCRSIATLLWAGFAFSANSAQADDLAGETDSVMPDRVPAANSTATADVQRVGAAAERIPSFYVRAVTGPLRNRSVCFPCRFGDRRVVMVVIHRLHSRIGLLMRNVDRMADRHRDSGVRSFGVWVTVSNQRSVSECQTFAFNERIQMPLGLVSSDAPPPVLRSTHTDLVAEVVLYEDSAVVERCPISSRQLDLDSLSVIARRIDRFSSQSADTQTASMPDGALPEPQSEAAVK